MGPGRDPIVDPLQSRAPRHAERVDEAHKPRATALRKPAGVRRLGARVLWA
jgi:hypothetical protein